MSNPRVSILLPTYNRASYLPETIASALAQTFQDFELVIVDDGSTDNTAELVQAIDDPRIKYIRQENCGVSGALNTALRAARGEFVAMLGSDDVWLPQQLRVLVPILDSGPKLGLVSARARAMNEKGELLHPILGTSLKFPGDALSSMLYSDSICAVACLIRRSFIERVGGFDEGLVANEDWDLWIRMAETSQFAYHDEILAYYRMHDASLTGKRSAYYQRIIAERVRLIESYYACANIPAGALKVKSLALRNVYMDRGIRLIAIGQIGEGVSSLWQAIRAHGNPITAALRVTGVTLYDLYLSKSRVGVRIVDALVARNHRMSAQ
jgi:glycosyltransferase involved in cell wall biosynthesis